MPRSVLIDGCACEAWAAWVSDRDLAEDHGEKGWTIDGCCGGACYVLSGMRFCPFCGSVLARSDVPATAP